ncbi:MAG TPA: hypothetical protein DCM64_12635 [Gammaproteobacteria bacterium]|nr:hypothetical protein [Gammaproteobacteria bacterium]|tara:strand:+ start:3973 stop:5064 length:1092 start_codon:yes stop_codon:yes gene_type:complete
MPKRKLCVLMPTHWGHTMGGAQYQAKLLIDCLSKSGEFQIYYLARRLDPEVQSAGYELRRVGRSQGAGFIFDTRTLLDTLREIQPDTIYQQVGCAYTGIAAYYCRNNPCTLVWQLASDPDVEPWPLSLARKFSLAYIDKKILEYGLRHADHIVAQSHHQVDLLESNYGRTASGIIRNFHPSPEESLDKQGKIKVLWIANLKTIKQPQIFIRLARDLKDLNAEFIMMGNFQGPQSWRDYVQGEIDKTSNVSYRGGLTQAEVNSLLASSHLLVNTSEFEGFSNTFIQAWMREVPVVSFNVDPDRLLSEGALGACATGDYEILLKQVRELIADSGKRSETGYKAKKYALKYHSEQNIEELRKLFLE